MARQTFYAEQSTRATTTAGTLQDFVTLNFTPDDNSTYWLIWAAIVDCSNNTTNADISVNDGTTTFALGEDITPSISNAEIQWNLSGIAELTYGSSPGAQTIKIQYTRAAGAGTVGIDKGRLLVIKASANDEFIDGGAGSSTDTYTTAATLGFTPGSSGDYLLMFSGEFNSSNGSHGQRFKLDKSGAVWETTQVRLPGTAAQYPLIAFIRQASLSGAQSYTLQHRNSGGFGVTVNVRKARILALRLDDFEDAQYAEQQSRATYNANTTDQDRVTLNFTPAAVEHVVLACALIDQSANSVSQQSVFKHKEDSTAKASVAVNTSSANDRIPVFSLYRADLSAVSTDFKISYATENTSNTVGISAAAVAVLQTQAIGGGGSESLTVENVDLPLAVEDVGLANASVPLVLDNVELLFDIEEPELESVNGPADADDIELLFDIEDVTLSIPGETLTVENVLLPIEIGPLILRVPGTGGVEPGLVARRWRRRMMRRNPLFWSG